MSIFGAFQIPKCPSSLHCHLRLTWFLLVPSKPFVCGRPVSMSATLRQRCCSSSLFSCKVLVFLWNFIHSGLPMSTTLCLPSEKYYFSFLKVYIYGERKRRRYSYVFCMCTFLIQCVYTQIHMHKYTHTHRQNPLQLWKWKILKYVRKFCIWREYL